MSTRRKQSYSVLIDVLPPYAIALSLLLFLGTILGSLSVLFFAPPVQQYVYEKLDPETKESSGSSFANLFKGGYQLLGDTEQRVTKANQEISFAILLRQSSHLKTIVKNDLQLEVSAMGKMNSRDSYGDPFRNIERHVRSLDCSYDSYFCKPIVVFRQRYIRYPFYRIAVKFVNLGDLYDKGFLDDVVFTRFEFTNKDYTVFETTLRTIFICISASVFIFYMISLLWSQQWSYCRTEQKWIALLLFSLNLFNNPLFIGDWVSQQWFFPLLNILFQSTFAAIFLLFLLVMTHSALVAPANRRFFFYAPKILLVCTLWILITLVLGWERFNEYYDPTVDVTDIKFFGPLRIAIGVIGGIILVQIFFYSIKAIGGDDIIETVHNALDTAGRVSYLKSSSSRFKIFFILTFLVVLTIAVDYMTFMLFDYANNAAQYLSLFPLVNYYAILLAIFFLPSNQVDNSGQAIIAPGTFKTNKGDNSAIRRVSRRMEERELAQQDTIHNTSNNTATTGGDNISSVNQVSAYVDESLSVEDED